MASAGLDFSKLTPTNGALTELSQLIFLAVMDPKEGLGHIVNFMPKQENGKKIGFVGEFGLMGEKAKGCSPTYHNSSIAADEKTWDIQEWEIAEQICYKDLVGTLAKAALNTGTSIDDITSTQYMDEVIMPRLELAIKKLILRLAFFGDKDIKTYNSGSATDGTLKQGVDAKYFNATDGLFKRIITGVTASKIARVEIAANKETTIAAQKTAFKKAGVATGILDSMIESAPAVLRQQEGQVIYVTQLFADALSADIKANNKGSELQWKSIFMGITETTYNGITVMAIPFWDEIIQGYLYNATNAGAYLDPYRAVFTLKNNLMVGTESSSELVDIDVFFDQTTRLNHIYAKDTLGTEIAQEDLMVVAY